MKNIVIGVITVAVFTVGAMTGKAQDYFYTTFQFGNIDYQLPPGPCQSHGGVKNSNTFVYDKSAWIYYSCVDGTEFQRRFFHPIDNIQTTEVVPPPVVSSPAPIIQSTCPTGFYPAIQGGCVDWNHPNRAR